jgi:hypothetical protein
MRKITQSQEEQLRSLYLQKLTFEEVDLGELANENLFTIARSEGNKELLEYVLAYYYNAGFHEIYCSDLKALLVEGWHDQHAEIVRIIQFKIHCKCSIGPLSQAVENQYDYLFEQDDYYPFVRKCFFAIGSLKTEEAKNALRRYVSNPDSIIRDLAQEQLSRLS